MAAPIVENWTDLKGQLIKSYPSATTEGFVTLEVEVSDVRSVEGFRNLLEDKCGELVRVNVPESLVGGAELKPGATISARVRMSGPRKLFAHPECLTVE